MRGDLAAVQIGKNTVVEDLAQLTSLSRKEGDKITIGDNCYVGPNVTLDACTLESFAHVAMGATVGRGSTVESFSVVAAGADVEPGTTVPSGQIWAGSPARYLRDLTQEEKHLLSEHHLEMQQLSQIYNDETEKSYREIVNHRDELIRYSKGDPEEKLIDYLGNIGMPVTHDDFDYIEHRIYHDYVGTVDYDMKDPNHEEGSFDKAWIPYEQDLTHYPEVFKQYQENY